MWQELTVIHRASQSALPAPEGSGLIWKTCLRSLYFAVPGSRPRDKECHHGLDAHRFLVEICSGLHSPLFGETEVFGQFRAFRAQHEWHPAWESLFDAVEEDVRKLRRTHLVDIGSQSYGSLARRHLPEGEPAIVIGGGRLALDLLPWLTGRPVSVAVRDPQRFTPPASVKVIPLAELPSLDSAHWLIAAPVTNEQLRAWWVEQPARLALDFRGESSLEPAPQGCERYFALRTLFEELETVRELHHRRRNEALAFAAELSRRRAQAVVHRPFGWEDAFA